MIEAVVEWIEWALLMFISCNRSQYMSNDNFEVNPQKHKFVI